jgi:hypothetical protein
MLGWEYPPRRLLLAAAAFLLLLLPSLISAPFCCCCFLFCQDFDGTGKLAASSAEERHGKSGREERGIEGFALAASSIAFCWLTVTAWLLLPSPNWMLDPGRLNNSQHRCRFQPSFSSNFPIPFTVKCLNKFWEFLDAENPKNIAYGFHVIHNFAFLLPSFSHPLSF